MKRLLLLLVLLGWAATPSLAQDPNFSVTFILNSSDQIGPNPQNRFDLRGTGVNNMAFQWWTTGTVSAGACALQGSVDGTTFGTTIIAAQTVTSSGGPTSLATGVTSNWGRINCTTPITGSGQVQFRVLGWISPPSVVVVSGSIVATQSNPTDLKVSIFDENGDPFEKVTDPCDGTVKTSVPFSISSATTTELANASASNKTYICMITITVASANNVALVEDDSDTCVSPTAGMSGGVTAATGWNLTGNGLSLGNGKSMIAVTAATNRYVCLITSGTAQTSGNVLLVFAP